MRYLSDGVSAVVLGTDFTPLSRVAFEAAVRAAALFDAELHILHAHEEALYLHNRSGDEVRGFMEELSQRRVEWLAQLEDAGQQAGLRVHAITRRGAASEAIVAYAEEVDAGVVVLGMVGSKGIRRLLTGSTAKRVMRRAERPVLTVSASAHVTPATPDTLAAGAWQHVLYPTDLSPSSRDGLAAAVQIARAADARLTVAHVLKMPGVVPSMPGEPTVLMPRGAVDGLAAHVADELAAWTADLGLEDVHTVVTPRADPAEGICEVATRVGADLIALPRRSAGVGHFLFGSTAEHVATIAPVPVLAFTPMAGARPDS